ncbi:MAG TPA: Fic family protein [Solirubrobacterales bacterium]|nr:Fic family protein [Solirubrobacterales bacterium]
MYDGQETPMVYEFPEIGIEEEIALAKIDNLRKELRFHVSEPRRWVGSVRRMLAARAIQGSNSIEGYNVSVEDAVAAIEDDEPSDARTEDWHAVMGYRRAMTYVLQLAEDEHFELSAHLLRSLHFMMAEYDLEASPGLWRQGPIWIRNDATGEVVYEGPDAEAVPGLVDELVAQLAQDQDVPPIVRGAMAHLNLVMVHPFRDGNGRMSRCLQTLVLARDKILAPAWCSIEEYLGANTQRYYDVLAQVGEGAWNPENDARLWVRFCLEAHYIQAMSVLRRVRESERMWSDLEALLEIRRDLPERSIQGLFDATLGLRVRNASYRSVLKRFAAEEVSHQVATSDLRALVEAGLLKQHGKKRGTYYVAAEPLNEIRIRARERRQPLDASSLFVAEAATAA